MDVIIKNTKPLEKKRLSIIRILFTLVTSTIIILSLFTASAVITGGPYDKIIVDILKYSGYTVENSVNLGTVPCSEKETILEDGTIEIELCFDVEDTVPKN